MIAMARNFFGVLRQSAKAEFAFTTGRFADSSSPCGAGRLPSGFQYQAPLWHKCRPRTTTASRASAAF